MTKEELKNQYEISLVNLAYKGLLIENKYLPPKHWESLRIKMQNTYRKATGETHAVLEIK